MTKQVINLGTVPNDRTGDPVRTAFGKTNQNFTELYDSRTNLPAELTLTINNLEDTTGETYGALHILGGGTVDKSFTVNDMLHVGNGAVNNQFMNPVIVAKRAGATYVQVALINSDGHGSADLVTYADNGTEEQGWCDMGITGSVFNDPMYTITEEGEGYIFIQGIDDGISHGSLVICTGDKGTEKNIIIGTGGFMHENARIELFHAEQRLEIYMDTDATDMSPGSFSTAGGAQISKNLRVGGSYKGGTALIAGGSDAVPVVLNLNTQVQKLGIGVYVLNDGTDGQILHLVRQTGVSNSSADCKLFVGKSRIAGVEYTNNFMNPFAAGADIVTLIFTDGAWQSNGGLWD